MESPETTSQPPRSSGTRPQKSPNSRGKLHAFHAGGCGQATKTGQESPGFGQLLYGYRREIRTVVSMVQRRLAPATGGHRYWPGRLAAAVHDSNDAITRQDRHRVIEAWNRGAVNTYGYSDAEMVGQNISLSVPAEKRA